MRSIAVLPLVHAVPRAAAEPDVSVGAGREALDPWWGGGYPWYDPRSDGVRRVEIAEPWDWDWLRRLWPGNLNLGLPDSLLQWAAWIVIVGLLVGVAYLLVRAYFRSGAGALVVGEDADSGNQENGHDRPVVLPLPARGSPTDLLAEATKYYRQADYGRAIVYLFCFQLAQLDRRQMIRLAKGKTNRQYLREIGQQGTLRRLLEQTMTAFEDAFFGHRTLDRIRFESCWSRLDEFDSLTEERTG